MAIAKFLDSKWIAPHALHPGAIQGKEGIKFCHLATMVGESGRRVRLLKGRENGLSLSVKFSRNLELGFPRPDCSPEMGYDKVWIY